MFTSRVVAMSVIVLFLFSLSCSPTGPDERFEAGPILFVSDKSGTWQLYCMKEDGSDVKQLTFDQSHECRWNQEIRAHEFSISTFY